MRNTVRKTSSVAALGGKLLFPILLLCFSVSGQVFRKGDEKKDFNPLDNKYSIRKTGPFLGIEYGYMTNIAFGAERQWKQLKLISPRTQAVFFELDYNFKYQVLGAQTGYWFKAGRLNLLYGGRLSWRTDFTYNRYGIAPFIGYKILQGELQVGYHFMTPARSMQRVNTFFVSAKWVLVNDRKISKKKG